MSHLHGDGAALLGTRWIYMSVTAVDLWNRLEEREGERLQCPWKRRVRRQAQSGGL